jgi:hypothetical protein
LCAPGYANLETRRISQIDDVILQAETLTPGRIAASSLIEVTLLRMNDAKIALG